MHAYILDNSCDKMVMNAVIFSDLLPFFIRSIVTNPSPSLTLMLFLRNSMHTTGDAKEERK